MRTWFDKLTGKNKPPRFTKSWAPEREAIYHWMGTWQRSLHREEVALPDEPPAEDESLRWAPGALDGTLAWHTGQPDDVRQKVGLVIHALQAVLAVPSDEAAVQSLYRLLNEGYPLSYIDALLQEIANTRTIAAERLRWLAEWLATQAPDRNVVKVAMALLMFFPGERSVSILTTLGAHDEFTLYSVVALRAMVSQEEYAQVWFSLARQAEGWGRIHLIERLPTPLPDEVRHWLLRAGYNNTVMNEYTAWHCASGGDLPRALQEEQDEALLLGAAGIIQALIAGGPARDMRNYDDNDLLCTRWLQRIHTLPPANLHYYLCASAIANWAAHQAEEDTDNAPRWLDLRHLAVDVLANPGWAECISEEFEQPDWSRFYLAVQASQCRGEDPWPKVYERQSRFPDESHWYTLLQTHARERASMVQALAEQQLNLAQIASGPSLEAGIGTGWHDHHVLDGILYGLQRFPGVGWSLVDAGLYSPLIHNRSVALQVLEAWSLPEDTRWRLEHLLRVEPDDELRLRISEQLATLSTA